MTTTTPGDTIRWEDLLPREFEERLAQLPLVYLPMGLCEPHGHVAAVLGTLIVRFDFLEIVPALAPIAAALALAGAAIILAIGALIVIWREGLDGVGAAAAGMFITPERCEAVGVSSPT